jgi:hypothetical protein
VTAFAVLVFAFVVGHLWKESSLLPVITSSSSSYSSVNEKIHGSNSKQSSLSSSSSSLQRRRIRARLVHQLPLLGLHGDGTDVFYRCAVGDSLHHFMYRKWGGLSGARQPLAAPLNATGVLDAHVQILDMNLRILIVGNSLSEQLHAGLEEAMCFPNNRVAASTNNSIDDDDSNNREKVRNQSICTTQFVPNDNEKTWSKDPRIVRSSSSGSDAAGGGMLGHVFYRTSLIGATTLWNRQHPAILKLSQALDPNHDDHDRNTTTTTTILPTGNKHHQVGNGKTKLLDVFVYQFPSGHVHYLALEERHLEAVVHAASDLFQATSVILPTIAWMNNVDDDKVEVWRQKNEMIRRFARNYTPNNGNTTRTNTTMTVRTVQVVDYAELSRNLIEINGQRILKLPENETYKLRLNNRWKSLVAHMCASLPFPNDPKGCQGGMLSADGMHLCPETLHGRVNAAFVCVLGCIYNNNNNHGGDHGGKKETSTNNTNNQIQTCSDTCNSRHMGSLEPIAFPPNGELELT